MVRPFLAYASLLSILGSGHSAAARGLEIAITVDDLPVHGPLPPGETRLTAAQQMITALRAAQVPSVYGFANGTYLDSDPQAESVLTAWRTAGYPLANHSFSHLNLNHVSSAEYLEDIVTNEPVLRRLSRGSDWRWFRYPFLAEGDDPAKRLEVRQFLGARGYRIAGVTMSYWDYEWNDAYARCRAAGDPASLDRLERAYLAAVKDGIDHWRRLAWSVYGRDIPYVLLTHISPFNARMFPRILALYKQQGFRFVTLQRATRHPAYRADLEPSLPPLPSLERRAAERGQPLHRQDPAAMLAAICR
jgi:peptidoglycan-N-acetylglucosamine deacetylase